VLPLFLVENIILDSKGFPHLSDFGVAHVQTDFSQDRTLTCRLASGTKQYLAPEVFTKNHVHGPESDYWALGVMAFELLFGRRPFDKHCPQSFIQYVEHCHALAVQRRMDSTLHHLQQSKKHSPTSTMSTSSSTTGMLTSPLGSSGGIGLHNPVIAGYPGRAPLRAIFLQQPPVDEVKDDQDNVSAAVDAVSTHHNNEGVSCGSLLDENWVCSHLPLQPSLRVVIPSQTFSSGPVSDACSDMIDGLLDARPTYRLGYRHRQAFHSHPWFVENDLGDWVAIQRRQMKPQFVPPDDYYHEISKGIQPLLDELKAGSSNSSGAGTSEPLFAEYYFVHPDYHHRFPVDHRCTVTNSSTAAAHASGECGGGYSLTSTSSVYSIYSFC